MAVNHRRYHNQRLLPSSLFRFRRSITGWKCLTSGRKSRPLPFCRFCWSSPLSVCSLRSSLRCVSHRTSSYVKWPRQRASIYHHNKVHFLDRLSFFFVISISLSASPSLSLSVYRSRDHGQPMRNRRLPFAHYAN